MITALRYLVVGSAAILLVLQSGGYLAQLSAYMGQSPFRLPATQVAGSVAGYPRPGEAAVPATDENGMQGMQGMDGMRMDTGPGER